MENDILSKKTMIIDTPPIPITLTPSETQSETLTESQTQSKLDTESDLEYGKYENWDYERNNILGDLKLPKRLCRRRRECGPTKRRRLNNPIDNVRVIK